MRLRHLRTELFFDRKEQQDRSLRNNNTSGAKIRSFSSPISRQFRVYTEMPEQLDSHRAGCRRSGRFILVHHSADLFQIAGA
jgi:hypothetical protein